MGAADWPPGWNVEEQMALVPGACTGTEEPVLEIRRLPFVDSTGYPIDGYWTQNLVIGFGSPQLGLARVEPGELYATTDGGRTWRSLGRTAYGRAIGQGPEIAFVDERVGWAIGYNFSTYNWTRRAVATFDGGRSWNEYLTSANDNVLVQFLEGTVARRGHWYMPDGAHAVIYGSNDGGATWAEIPAPWTNAEARRDVRHYDRLMVFGDQNLFISGVGVDFPLVDFTGSWDPTLYGPESYWQSFDRFDELGDPHRRWRRPPGQGDDFVLSDPQGPIPEITRYLLRTVDDGRTWRSVPLELEFDPPPGRDVLKAAVLNLVMVDAQHGWLRVIVWWPDDEGVPRWHAQVYCTGDGALSWHLVRPHGWPEVRAATAVHLPFALDYRHVWFLAFSLYRIAPVEPE